MYIVAIQTAEHTILACDRWSQWRRELEEGLNVRISRENIIGVMISSASNWGKIHRFVKKVLQKKRIDERETEQAGGVD